MQNGLRMGRELTTRQRLFAAGVASGLSRTKAHLEAYPNNMKQSTRETAAKQAAKNPRVKAEIERLTLELLPKVEDMRAAYEHAYSTILKLTIESPDDRIRFDAARWLRAEYEKREQLSDEPAPDPTQETLAALHELYERVMRTPGMQPPLTLEVGPEDNAPETASPPSDLSADAAVAEAALPEDRSGEVEERPDVRERDTMRSHVPGRFPPLPRPFYGP
jgi:hypothetical protein